MPRESALERPGPRNGAIRTSRILIVDDSDLIRNTLTTVLAESGFTAASAIDGMEGLKMANAESFDLVLTDIEMARLNGLEMIRLLRMQLKHKELPILVYTASGQHAVEALDAGANDVMIKSGEIEDLMNRILDMIRQ